MSIVLRAELLPAYWIRYRAGAAGLLLIGVCMAAGRASAANTQVRVEATVMRHASVAFHAPRTISITAEDVARGYAELSEPIEVAVRTNAREGLRLGFSLRSRHVGVAVLAGEGRELRVSQESVMLPLASTGPGLGTRLLRLAARFELRPGTVPGPIAFPVSLFVAPY